MSKIKMAFNWAKKHKFKIACVCAVGVAGAISYYIGKRTGFDLGLKEGGEIEGKHIDEFMNWHDQEVKKGFGKITDVAVNESINHYMMKNYKMVNPEKDFESIMERVNKNKAIKQILQRA